MADPAGVADHTAGAAAGRAAPLDEKETLLRPHLAHAATGGAGVALPLLALGTGALASLAIDAGLRLHLNLGAEEGLAEVDLDVGADIAADARCSTARATATAAAHEIAEHLVEDIAQTAGLGEVEPGRTGTATAALESRMAKAVVGRPLLIVLENLVSLVRFLEARLSLLVARIAVRVELHRQLAIRLLQVVRAGISGDAQCCVVVVLRHGMPSAPLPAPAAPSPCTSTASPAVTMQGRRLPSEEAQASL